MLRSQDGGAWDRMNEADTRIRQASADLFAMPTQTVVGVLAKTRLAHEMFDYLARGDAETWHIYNDERPSFWTRQIQRDLERLVGGAS